jgi:D-3-phosphoglycerate dehydrogenase
VIGKFGTLLGENDINIADFSLGRRETHEGPGEPAEAVAVVRIDGPIPKNVLDQLAGLDAVRFARAIELAD